MGALNLLTKEVRSVSHTSKKELRKPTIDYVESLWFDHHDMVKKLKELELTVSSVSNTVDENAGIRATGRISKPVEQAVIREMTDTKKRERLEEQIHVIETVYNMLPSDYKKVVHARYYSRERRTWAQIAKRSGYSVKQAQRVRDVVIVATAEMLGLW